MGARSKARKRALDLLYASELRGDDTITTLDQRIADGEGPTNAYTSVLIRGVVEPRRRIDELLSSYSQGWSLERMPAIDRNALRIGVYELEEGTVPAEVAINEAVVLAKRYATDEAGKLVNGILGRIQREEAA